MFANAANVEKLVGSGVFSIIEVLRAAGLPAISEDWADKHYLTKNIATLGSETSVLGGAEGGNA